MNNKEVLEFISEVEKRLKERDAQHERLFLIMRAFLYDAFRTEKKRQKRNRKGLINTILSTVYSFFKFRSILRSKRILLVSPNSHFNITIENKFFSKHIEGLKKFLGGCKPFTITVGRDFKGIELNVSVLSRAYYEITQYSRRKSVAVFLEDFEYICRVISEERSAVLPFNVSSIETWIIKVLSYKAFYKLLFPKEINIDKVVFVAYYDLNSLGLISALSSRGVATIDYQHGIQNNFHPMYCELGNIEGAIGLPQCFWGWDNVAKKRIEGSLGSEHFRLVGNLWFQSDYYQDYKKNVIGGNNTILVALQRWPDYFNNAVFDIVERNKQYQFVFREHPLNRIQEQEKTEIKSRFHNLSFEDISNKSLESSISECFLCMTGYSTVGIEASYAGKIVIFFHENAKLGLMDYINGESIFYADTSQRMQLVIDQYRKETKDIV